jgi:hypothetical protein
MPMFNIKIERWITKSDGKSEKVIENHVIAADSEYAIQYHHSSIAFSIWGDARIGFRVISVEKFRPFG